ncbi:hypothetical protein Tco_0987349 [Tanacetum coccineum]
MRADELYKFSDGTLKKVQDELHHRIHDFCLEYNTEMPRRKWTAIDRKRSELMVELIDKQMRQIRSFGILKDCRHGPTDAMHNPSQPLKVLNRWQSVPAFDYCELSIIEFASLSNVGAVKRLDQIATMELEDTCNACLDYQKLLADIQSKNLSTKDKKAELENNKLGPSQVAELDGKIMNGVGEMMRSHNKIIKIEEAQNGFIQDDTLLQLQVTNTMSRIELYLMLERTLNMLLWFLLNRVRLNEYFALPSVLLVQRMRTYISADFCYYYDKR